MPDSFLELPNPASSSARPKPKPSTRATRNAPFDPNASLPKKVVIIATAS